MLYVTTEELRKKIMEGFRDFLVHQVEKNPKNKTIRDFLEGFED